MVDEFIQPDSSSDDGVRPLSASVPNNAINLPLEAESGRPSPTSPSGERTDRRTDSENPQEPTGFEPELGGYLRDSPERTGFEPELGGLVRQNGVYVDELTCIGCKNCAHVARNTFHIEDDYGRARVTRQDGDPEEMIQEAIDTCPVNCIHWVDYTELKQLERKRKFQVIKPLGFPVSRTESFKAERQRRS